MSENSGAAEDPNRSLPGAVLGNRENYEGYGLAGAHVSSTPFRKTKKFTHEGGIATPLIVYWLAGLLAARRGELVRQVGHVIDLMPTCIELAEAKFPTEWSGTATLPPEGVSLLPAWRGGALRRAAPLFWEHEGHRAVRDGKWKLVASHGEPWELYDMERDGTELHDLASVQKRRVRALAAQYEAWAARVGVKPWPQPFPRATVQAANPLSTAQ